MSHLRAIPYAVLTISLLAAGGASAQSMWSIDQREANQQQRLDRYEARARADGVVTSGERQRLDGRHDRESRAVTRERNDGQRAGGHDNGNHYGWDRGNHNGWNKADAGRNGWNRDPRSNGGGQNHGSWNHGGQSPAQGATPPTQAGWNGNGQGTGPSNGPSNGRHSWGHQPSPNGTTTAPPATTPANGQNNGYARGSQARVMPISAPATSAVAPSRAPSSSGGGRTSRR